MSKEKKEELKDALREAEITDVEMDNVSGGTCDESCRSGCSACCETGSANRGGGVGGGIDYQY